MKAIVYGDKLGKDEEFVEIPEDMKEKPKNTVRLLSKQLLKAMTT